MLDRIHQTLPVHASMHRFAGIEHGSPFPWIPQESRERSVGVADGGLAEHLEAVIQMLLFFFAPRQRAAWMVVVRLS